MADGHDLSKGGIEIATAFAGRAAYRAIAVPLCIARISTLTYFHTNVAARLIDGATDGHIWPERGDAQWAYVFDLQDKITRNVVVCIQTIFLRFSQRLANYLLFRHAAASNGALVVGMLALGPLPAHRQPYGARPTPRTKGCRRTLSGCSARNGARRFKAILLA